LNNMIRDLQPSVFNGFACIIEQSLSQCLQSKLKEVKGHGKINEFYYRLNSRLVRNLYKTSGVIFG
jgi:hypothetical protein